MVRYLARRIGTMLVTLLIVSVLIFWIINLPPGDFLSNQIAELRAQGEAASIEKAEFLRKQYSLDQPLWKQYLIWLGVAPGYSKEVEDAVLAIQPPMSDSQVFRWQMANWLGFSEGPHGFNGLVQGDLGWSFEYDQPVSEVLGEAVWLTVIVNLAAMLFIYVVSLPLGALAAVRAGSWLDYLIAIVGYIGLATPNFLLALILLYYGQRYLGIPVGGLMDPALEGQPLNLEKIKSVLMHLIVPTIVIGTAGTAAMIRRLRANLLDELGKPYVVTAKAKGLSPTRRVVKYPLRAALNPFVADIGNLLPSLVSGSVLVSVVLSLPTLGPALLAALQSQDHYLAGFILLFVSALTLVGMLVSDILLAILDPRIRFGGRAR